MIKTSLAQLNLEIEKRRAASGIDFDRDYRNSGLRRSERKRIILQDLALRFPGSAIKSNFIPGPPKF